MGVASLKAYAEGLQAKLKTAAKERQQFLTNTKRIIGDLKRENHVLEARAKQLAESNEELKE